MTVTGASPVWLVGHGNLGSALRDRWQATGQAVVVVDTRQALPLAGTAAPAVVVLAVKPQVWTTVATSLADHLASRLAETTIVSVMAGVTTADLAARFPTAGIVRTIPNTPSRIGRGMTPMIATAATRPAQRAAAETLMAAVGATVWLDDEDDFAAASAVAASGPAFVFAFIEALAAAGAAAGLAPALAARLALATVDGAAALAAASDATPAALRAAVTSAKGMTAAGLAVLQPALDGLVRETVAAAAARSRELGRMK